MHTVKPDSTGEEEFANELLTPMLQYCEYLIKGVVLDDQFTLTGEQNQSRIKIEIDFVDEKNIGILIGPKFRVVNALLTMLRFQQFCPHNRWIELHLIKDGDKPQVVQDRKVFIQSRE